MWLSSVLHVLFLVNANLNSFTNLETAEWKAVYQQGLYSIQVCSFLEYFLEDLWMSLKSNYNCSFNFFLSAIMKFQSSDQKLQSYNFYSCRAPLPLHVKLYRGRRFQFPLTLPPFIFWQFPFCSCCNAVVGQHKYKCKVLQFHYCISGQY